MLGQLGHFLIYHLLIMSDPVKPIQEDTAQPETAQIDSAQIIDSMEQQHINVESIIVPTGSTSARSRSPSPSITVAAEYMIATQYNIQNTLTMMAEQATHWGDPEVTLNEIRSQLNIIETEWAKFWDHHNKLTFSTHKNLATHPYITDKVYEKTFKVYYSANSLAYRHIQRLEDIQTTQTPTSGQHQPTSSHQNK